jgi:hypothetical protein
MSAWGASGSIAAADWLPVSIVVAALLIVALASGTARRPSAPSLVALAALLGLASWAALSLTWSPLPSLARDEAMLTLTYALVFALPVVLLRCDAERLAAAGTVAAAAGALLLATSVELVTGENVGRHFEIRRLEFPIAYPNAQAAVLVVGFWPALALAAGRSLPLALRAASTGVATMLLGGWLATQSKGAGLGLAASAALILTLAPNRLRLAVPAALAAVCAAVAARPLTAPYRVDAEAVEAAAADVGSTLLLVAGTAAVLGLGYALLDRRLHLRLSHVRVANLAAAVLIVATAVAAAVAFASTVGRPDDALRRGWNAFSTYHPPGGETHLTSLGGSNRYDFWRVSLSGARDHPIAGIGARGFQAEYLRRGESAETPARAHSLPLEVLLELGAVGVALLLLALVPPLALAARATRRGALHGIAAGGAATVWLTQALVDWTWTFPAAGIPFFLLLGVAASAGRTGDLAPRTAFGAGLATAAVTVAGLAPPWLSARLSERALFEPSRAAADIRLAQRLDPLALQPLLAEAALAPTPDAALPPLRRAAEMEPRAAGIRYRLGMTLIAAGRTDEARRELEAAAQLAPRDALIRAALERVAEE